MTISSNAALIERDDRELVEIARFADRLRDLHRLSTTSYDSLQDAFQDHLRTGRRWFGWPTGLIVQTEGCRTTILAADGDQPEPTSGNAPCIKTPIMLGTETFATLSFSSAAGHVEWVSSTEQNELIELMARSLGRIVEQSRVTDRLAFQARHDSLTELPNRVYFLELLEAALAEARKRESPLAVLFIDLDRFKQINDTLGHAIGDGLLQNVAARLQRLLTAGHPIGRMGGDEFTIVLPRPRDIRSVIRTSQELLSTLREPYRVDGHELFVTASAGVAMFPEHGHTAADLLHSADLAMYRAKSSGKDSVALFVTDDLAVGLERLRLENALRRALQNQEFEILYQPVMRMDGEIDGLEALLTWRQPIYGTISPKRFIPIAEEAGLIVPIGSWVLRQACLEGARWRKAGHIPIRISVNVSALQFERADFSETVADALALSGFPSKCLELELTESCVMRDFPGSVVRMSQVRDLGVSISIDDFGTGYSSLSYLTRLPVDSLKIDQSFLRNLQEPEGSLLVVQSIVRLAHSMNLTVVAEGVETAAELDLVRVLGCDKVQGHIYGPSLSPQATEALLLRNSLPRT
jgi:diguanylate cyclase (GGDEF)-like protein